MQWNPILLILRRPVNTDRLLAAVIPAKARIQSVSGCRIKSGMTNYWNAESTRRYLLISVVLVTVLSLFGSWSCSRGDYLGSLETITIAGPPLEQNALLYVADQKRFFADHGLKVVIKDYDSGVTNLKSPLY
jgi:hypothetical protein